MKTSVIESEEAKKLYELYEQTKNRTEFIQKCLTSSLGYELNEATLIWHCFDIVHENI